MKSKLFLQLNFSFHKPCKDFQNNTLKKRYNKTSFPCHKIWHYISVFDTKNSLGDMCFDEWTEASKLFWFQNWYMNSTKHYNINQVITKIIVFLKNMTFWTQQLPKSHCINFAMFLWDLKVYLNPHLPSSPNLTV